MAKYYSWENLQNKPEEMDQFIGLIEGIDGLISSKVDNRLKDFAGQLLAMKNNPTLPDAQEIFDRGIEMLGDRLGYYNEAYKDEYSEKIEQMKGLDGYRELEAELPLAMKGTLGYEAESIWDQIYDYKTEGTVAYPGTERLFNLSLPYLVFTAGIGEHSDYIRARVCDKLGLLGVKLDAEKNAASNEEISAPDSAVRVLVIPTNEELGIARRTYEYQ